MPGGFGGQGWFEREGRAAARGTPAEWRTGKAVRDSYQGVSKDKIARVLRGIALAGNNDLVDGVFALLDDETPSWFANAPEGATRVRRFPSEPRSFQNFHPFTAK